MSEQEYRRHTRNVTWLYGVTSEEYGKCVPILEHFEEKNVANAKYASRCLQSPQKRAQPTERILITKYDAAEVLIPVTLGTFEVGLASNSKLDLRAEIRPDDQESVTFLLKNHQKIQKTIEKHYFSDFRGCVCRAHGRHRASCATPHAGFGHEVW